MYLSVCLSLSLSICGVVPADQSTLARYKAFQVPFPINLSWLKPIIMVLIYALSIRNRYPPTPVSKSGPDALLIFQCSGTCPNPSQGDILVSDLACFSPTMHNKIFTQAEIRAISELRMRLIPLNLLKLCSACFSFADSSRAVQIMLINF